MVGHYNLSIINGIFVISESLRTVTKRYKSEVLRVAYEMATDLHPLGLIDTKTMRDLETSCLTSNGNRGSVTKEIKLYVPNKETMKAMKAARRGELVTAGKPDVLIEKLKAGIKTKNKTTSQKYKSKR
jgi:hypothetical protein